MTSLALRIEKQFKPTYKIGFVTSTLPSTTLSFTVPRRVLKYILWNTQFFKELRIFFWSCSLRIKYVGILYQNQLPWKYNLFDNLKKEIEFKKDEILPWNQWVVSCRKLAFIHNLLLAKSTYLNIILAFPSNHLLISSITTPLKT